MPKANSRKHFSPPAQRNNRKHSANYHENHRQMGKSTAIKLFGSSMGQLLEQISRRLSQPQSIMITTPNPEFIVYAQEHLSFRKIINNADFAIPDGSYLFWARELQKRRKQQKDYQNWGKWRRLAANLFWGAKISCQLHCGNLAENRITGTDLVPQLLKMAAKKKGYVFFLGGGPGIAAKAAGRLQKLVPGWQLAGNYAGDGSPKGDRDTRKAIQSCGKPIFLLLVAYGMGKQERWLKRNSPYLKVKIAIGVGGAFDYYADRVPRAPLWLRRHGLEWLYRLIRQPWRWRRQIKLLRFLWLIVNEQVYLNF